AMPGRASEAWRSPARLSSLPLTDDCRRPRWLSPCIGGSVPHSACRARAPRRAGRVGGVAGVSAGAGCANELLQIRSVGEGWTRIGGMAGSPDSACPAGAIARQTRGGQMASDPRSIESTSQPVRDVIVEIHDVSRRFEDREVLSGINL